jgi:hypothetical protein
VAAAIETAVGPGARLVRDGGPTRFDVLPLLVATDGAITALGLDRRRFRPNILVAGGDGLAERAWPGAAPASAAPSSPSRSSEAAAS